MDSAKVINDDEGQVVLLPEGHHLPGDYAFVKKVNRGVLLLPSDSPWDPLFESLEEFSDDFMEDRDQPMVEQARNWSF